MAEGKGKSFAECMLGILAELGKAEAYPDADPNIVQGVRDLVLPAVQQNIAAQDPMAMMQAAMGAGPEGPPEAPPEAVDPMQMEQAPTRLPRRPMGDPREGAAAIERQLSGINPA